MDGNPDRKSPVHAHVVHLAGAERGVLRMKKRKKKVWHYVYLARARDGTYYCGYALDPRARLVAHNTGRGAKALRGRKPVTLAFVRRCATKTEALRFEIALKRRSHSYKENLARRWRAKASS